LEKWYENYVSKAMTASVVTNHLRMMSLNCSLREALPDEISDIESPTYTRRLGKALRKQLDVRHVNGFYLDTGANEHNARAWRVQFG